MLIEIKYKNGDMKSINYPHIETITPEFAREITERKSFIPNLPLPIGRNMFSYFDHGKPISRRN